MDYNTASNSELYAERDRLSKEFEESKEQLTNSYARMLSLSEEYGELKKVIDRREGNG